MPSFILQYDMNYEYFEEEDAKTPPAVYSAIARKLKNLGWYRTQYSVWRRDRISFKDTKVLPNFNHISKIYTKPKIFLKNYITKDTHIRLVSWDKKSNYYFLKNLYLSKNFFFFFFFLFFWIF